MEDLRTKATHGVFWSIIERFSVQGVQFLIGIIMARLLSPHDYGLIGMLAIFMSLSQVFIDGGFSTALIQRQDRTNEDYSTVFYINMLISIFLYGCIFLSAPWIAVFFNQPILVDIARIYCFNLVINSLAAVHKTKLVIDVDFKTQSKISLISATVSGCVGIWAAYHGYGVWALVIQSMIGAVLNVLFCYVLVRWLPAFCFSFQSSRRLFKFGSKVLIATIISEVYTNLYSMAIGKKFSSADLGYYTRAVNFLSLVSQNLSTILARVSLPILSTIQDDDERLIKAYRSYMITAAYVIFPMVLCLCGLSKPIVLLLLTDKWSNTIILMQILSFSYLWDPVTKVNLNLLYVKGRSDLLLKLEIVKKTIAFTILCISLFFNLKVVCLGLALYSFIAVFLNCHYTNKLLNYGFTQQMKDLFPCLMLSFVVFGECLIICELLTNNMLALILSIILSIFSYLSLSCLFNLKAYNEIIMVYKKQFKSNQELI